MYSSLTLPDGLQEKDTHAWTAADRAKEAAEKKALAEREEKAEVAAAEKVSEQARGEVSDSMQGSGLSISCCRTITWP